MNFAAAINELLIALAVGTALGLMLGWLIWRKG